MKQNLEAILAGRSYAFKGWRLFSHRGKFMLMHASAAVKTKTISREKAERIVAHSECPVCGGFLTSYHS